MLKNKVWVTLVDLKFKTYQLEYLLVFFQKRERSINIFLAIASSGSIGAWAVWQKFTIVWASIIALSQVINVLKPYFPYHKYITEISAKCVQVDFLNIEFEKLWSKLQNGTISDKVAEDIYYEHRKQLVKIFTFRDDTIFDVDDKMERKANERVRVFLESNYGIMIEIK